MIQDLLRFNLTIALTNGGVPQIVQTYYESMGKQATSARKRDNHKSTLKLELGYLQFEGDKLARALIIDSNVQNKSTNIIYNMDITTLEVMRPTMEKLNK